MLWVSWQASFGTSARLVFGQVSCRNTADARSFECTDDDVSKTDLTHYEHQFHALPRDGSVCKSALLSDSTGRSKPLICTTRKFHYPCGRCPPASIVLPAPTLSQLRDHGGQRGQIEILAFSRRQTSWVSGATGAKLLLRPQRPLSKQSPKGRVFSLFLGFI